MAADLRIRTKGNWCLYHQPADVGFGNPHARAQISSMSWVNILSPRAGFLDRRRLQHQQMTIEYGRPRMDKYGCR